MPPSIITNQARARLPPKWMTPQPPTTTTTTPALTQQHDTFRWSTHTLAPESEQVSKSDGARPRSSSPYDSVALRRKSRISDLTCVDIDDDGAFTSNDAPSHRAHTPDTDSDDEGEDLSARIDHLMASTMQALEASNRLVLDTLETRAKLAQLHSAEAALDSHFTSREASLRRQIQAVDDMSDFVSRKSLELQQLTAPSGVSATSMKAVEHASVSAQGAGVGIVQALDRDATIGKTAAKRLEKMLQGGPASPTAPRRASGSRRTFSVNTFGPTHDSIAEEERGPSQAQSPRAVAEIRTPTASPSKKRSVSYDVASDRGAKLMPTLAGPSRAVSSSSAFGPSAAKPADSDERAPHSADTSAMTSSSSVGSAETSLAALLGMSSRTETPSDSSYFDSSLEDSLTSASPSTPGSIYAVHDVFSNGAVPISRRSSGMHTGPRASFSLSERDKSSDPFQLAQLRAEQVTWHSKGTNRNTGADAAAPREATARGGALKALQRLNDMSSAKLAAQPSTDDGGHSKRSSLGLGLPGFSALRPITNRVPSTSVADTAPETPRPDLPAASRPSGWKGWTSWNASSTTLTQ